MQSKITLTGMYNFDNSLFDNLVLPAGIDKNIVVNRILNKSEEFELVYSDFDYLKDRIGIWGEIWERTFKKWYEALQLEYNPLDNYDRHEIYTDTHKRDYKDNEKENSSTTSSTTTESDSSSTTEQKVSAYDETDYSDKQYEESGATTGQSGSGSASGNINRDYKGDSNETIKHEAHLYGNIGVTTSVQMLREQLDVVTFNLYEHISDIFIDEFCILVY